MKIERIKEVIPHPFLAIGSLRYYNGNSNENIHKAICLISKTTTLQMQNTFLHISRLSLRDYIYEVKMPSLPFFWTMCTSNGEIFFSFLNLDMVLRNLTQEEFPCIWQRKQVRIIATDRLKGCRFTFEVMFLPPLPLWYLKLPNNAP